VKSISIFRLRDASGFTLIELVAVILVIAVLAAIAVQKLGSVGQSAKIEETKRELDRLAAAIAGNPNLHNDGTRNDFGYIGDVGSLPPNLDALVTDPGFATWNGPYIQSDFAQYPDDYKEDAWQTDYTYGGIVISSIGSGETIQKRLAASADHLLRNTLAGNLYDRDGTPPGNEYKDSLSILLAVPDGGGGVMVKSSSADHGGYFAFDSIPIGNHRLEIVYRPDDDTLRRYVSVPPKSRLYGEYYLTRDVWPPDGSAGGGIEFVPDSDTLTSGNCFRLVFWIANTDSAPITVSSMTLAWPAPTAYYRRVRWDANLVRDGNPTLGSGDAAVFSSPQTIDPGTSVRIRVESFHENVGGGGPPVDMTGAQFTVVFSDGSTITFTADLCTG